MDPIRVLSPRVKLHWLGWQADTATLGRHGWQISVQNEIDYHDRMRIAIRHPEFRVYGMANIVSGLHERYMRSYARGPAGIFDHIRDIEVGMQLSHQIMIADMTGPMSAWTPIDPEPAIVETEYSYQDLDELAMFRRLPPEDRQIIVPDFSFEQIMKMALEHQAPKQKELREKYRRQRQAVDPGALIHVAA